MLRRSRAEASKLQKRVGLVPREQGEQMVQSECYIYHRLSTFIDFWIHCQLAGANRGAVEGWSLGVRTGGKIQRFVEVFGQQGWTTQNHAEFIHKQRGWRNKTQKLHSWVLYLVQRIALSCWLWKQKTLYSPPDWLAGYHVMLTDLQVWTSSASHSLRPKHLRYWVYLESHQKVGWDQLTSGNMAKKYPQFADAADASTFPSRIF